MQNARVAFPRRSNPEAVMGSARWGLDDSSKALRRNHLAVETTGAGEAATCGSRAARVAVDCGSSKRSV